MNWTLFLAMLWALGLLYVFLSLPRFLSRHSRRVARKQAVLLIVGVALIARLLPNFLLPMGAGYDIESYQIVGNLVLEHSAVYTNTEAENRHPYLPLQMYWMAAALWGTNRTGIPFVKIVRLAPIAADVGISILLFEALRRASSERDNVDKAFLGGMAYAVNPVPIFVSAYHGQFDALPALFILLSWYTLTSAHATTSRVVRSALWLGLGVLDKSWPVLVWPILLGTICGWRKKGLYLFFVGAIPLLGITVYAYTFHASPWPMLQHVLGYNWGVGVWGYSYLLFMLSVFVPGISRSFRWIIVNGRYLTLMALGVIWWIRARHESPEAGILTILISFFAVTHAFSIQYLMWVVPFALLNQEHLWLRRYTLAVFSYMLLTYMTLILEIHITQWMPWPQADWYIIRLSALPAWLVVVGWARNRLLQPFPYVRIA